MTIWAVIVLIQLFLFFVWIRTAWIITLYNKADIFLRKSKLLLIQNQYNEEVKDIVETKLPKYTNWKVEGYILVVLVFFVFTLIPVIGIASTEGNSSAIANTIIAVLLGFIVSATRVIQRRVDILNIECDYIDNLVNIIKSNQAALEHDNQ